MTRTLISLSVALGIAFSASVVAAGTYVTGPLPSEFGAGFIPPDRGVLKNVQKASKEGAKLAASVEKCYSKGAQDYSKGKALLVGPCIDIAVAKYQIKTIVTDFKAPGISPCFDYLASGDVVAALVKGFNGLTYCQSPSGAFVDGMTNF